MFKRKDGEGVGSSDVIKGMRLVYHTSSTE